MPSMKPGAGVGVGVGVGVGEGVGEGSGGVGVGFAVGVGFGFGRTVGLASTADGAASTKTARHRVARTARTRCTRPCFLRSAGASNGVCTRDERDQSPESGLTYISHTLYSARHARVRRPW